MITNRNCIIRLSRYKNALGRLKQMGFVKVFSDNLADAVGVTPAQVRKDFSIFDITGSKRGGYQIDQLIEKLNHILGKDELQKVVIAGAGHIGTALMKYKGFQQEGIKIVAVFDIDPGKLDEKAELPVYPLEKLKSFVREHNIKVGIIAVPDTAAPQVLEMMITSGIKGVLNFAPIRLRPSQDIVINNVNLELELENVIYYMKSPLTQDLH